MVIVGLLIDLVYNSVMELVGLGKLLSGDGFGLVASIRTAYFEIVEVADDFLIKLRSDAMLVFRPKQQLR